MSEEIEIIDQNIEEDNNLKYYSLNAILFGTFLGGPLATGILFRKNFLNQNKEKESILSLVIGFLSMVLVMSLAFLIPEYVPEKIPNIAIPALYIGIAYWLTKKYFEKKLQQHAVESKPFYSNWRVAGISISCSLIFLSGIYGVNQLVYFNFDTKKYDEGIAQFTKNEEKALELFSMLEENDMLKIDYFIKDVGIPLWKENIVILQDLNKIEGLTNEYLNQNKMLIEYCELRIESYLLIQKAVIESTDKYDDEIIKIHNEIDELLKQ